jgi:hypothetical protein
MRKTARFLPNELRAYHEGYYTGCIMALRVAEEAIHRFKLREQTHRAAARQKRTA